MHVKESRSSGGISQRNQNTCNQNTYLGEAREAANGSDNGGSEGTGTRDEAEVHAPLSIDSLAPPVGNSMVVENLKKWMSNPSYLVKREPGGEAGTARAGAGADGMEQDDAVGHAEEAMGIPANLMSIAQPVSRDGGSALARNREAKEVELDQECPLRLQGRGHEPNIMLKDNDLNYKLRFHPEQAPAVAEQLARDSALLCRHNIMDYSLLLGVMIAEYDIGEEGAAENDGYDSLGGNNITSVGGSGAGGGGGEGIGMERLFQSVGDRDEEGRGGVGSISEDGEAHFTLTSGGDAGATEGITADGAAGPPASPRGGRPSSSGPSPPPVGTVLPGVDLMVGSYSSYPSSFGSTGVGFVGLDASPPYGPSSFQEGDDVASSSAGGTVGTGVDEPPPRPSELVSTSSNSGLPGSLRTGMLRRRTSTTGASIRQSRGSTSGSFGSTVGVGAVGNGKVKVDDDGPDTPRRGPGNDGEFRAAAAHAAKTPLKRPSKRSGYTAGEEYGRQVRQSARESHIFQRQVYFLGVIDVLQTWDWRKRLEQWYKVNVLRQSPVGISAVSSGSGSGSGSSSGSGSGSGSEPTLASTTGTHQPLKRRCHAYTNQPPEAAVGQIKPDTFFSGRPGGISRALSAEDTRYRPC